MAEAYDKFVVTEEPLPYITLFDFNPNWLGRNSDLIIGDPDIPAKLALQTSDLFDPNKLKPFLGLAGSGLFEAILMPAPPDFTVFPGEAWQVFQLRTGGALFDPATSLHIGDQPPTAGDDVIDLAVLAQTPSFCAALNPECILTASGLAPVEPKSLMPQMSSRICRLITVTFAGTLRRAGSNPNRILP